MKLVDLDGVMFVPVVDETHGGAVVEMKMTVGEFFEKCCQGFEPEVVEAIPVGWISQYMNAAYGRVRAEIIREMLDAWMEQEAQDG
jgi:hypothetical protein